MSLDDSKPEDPKDKETGQESSEDKSQARDNEPVWKRASRGDDSSGDFEIDRRGEKTQAEINRLLMAPRPMPLRILSLMSSGLFFASQLFTAFAPLPLLMAYVRGNWQGFSLSIAVGFSICFLLGGLPMAIIYGATVGVASVALCGLLFGEQPRVTLERGILASWLSMALGIVACWLIMAATVGKAPVEFLQSGLHELLIQIDQRAQGLQWDEPLEIKEQQILRDLPSIVGVFGLLMIVLNLVIVLRINPFGLRERLGLPHDFIIRWKTPEWMIWPTIAFGGLAVFGQGWMATVGMNAVWLLLAVYSIQGFSITIFFLERARIRGFWRLLVLILLVVWLSPLVMALGFFDLWFDFRARLTKTDDESA